ncbi:MAG: acylphosphatase [Burkholderiales bacterium]|jgi:acylphosphatase|nr:acylphosphatase [Burkholderiales bacterium]
MGKLLRIHGRVQGVGYRESLRWEAERRGATGWVRNRRDGTVEAAIDGDPAVIDALIDWCRAGPPAARVTAVDVADIDGPFAGFARLPTV